METSPTPSDQSPNVFSGIPPNLATPLAIIIGAVIIAGAVLWGGNSLPSPNAPATGGQPVALDSSKVKTDGDPIIGEKNAPVTVAYWFDYQCPFCQRHETESLPQLIQDYVVTGQVKIVLKDFQFLGPDSQTAALAARAVWEVAPAKFYEWHMAVFAAQDAENGGWGSEADILALTRTIAGIDTVKVKALMSNKASEYQKEIDADKAEGASLGVSGTPAMIIGTQAISGAVPYAQIKAAVEAALAAK